MICRIFLLYQIHYFQTPFDVTSAKDLKEKKGLLSFPRVKEVEGQVEMKEGEDWKVKEGWGVGVGRVGEEKKSSPQNGLDAGQQAVCWVS